MFEKLYELKGNWYGQLGDLVSELIDIGIDLEGCSCINREYIGFNVEDEDGYDYEVILHLGGTERTITVDSIEVRR